MQVRNKPFLTSGSCQLVCSGAGVHQGNAMCSLEESGIPEGSLGWRWALPLDLEEGWFSASKRRVLETICYFFYGQVVGP